MQITKANSLKGEITVPGDKSVSHRGIMLGSLAEGVTEVHNFLQSDDCLSTIDCFNRLGIEIENKKDYIKIYGKGLNGLKKPNTQLNVNNSGTTLRLMSGILSAQPFETNITGDDSIQRRPMLRVIEPLSLMGASITSINNNNCAPLLIQGNPLHSIDYVSKVASAQVKSAIILAGLYADGITSVTEPYISRNHTEIMLRYFGGNISTKDTTVSVQPATKLTPQKVIVPGDISSAAYFIVAGLITPNSEIIIKNVGINPTRAGILEVCKNMGASIKLENINLDNGEPVADIIVTTSSLKGTVIEGSIIPTLIDELPIIAVLACFAEGTTIIKDASELKVKESNRIDVMVNNLTKMGASVFATDDGMIIHGGKSLKGADIESHHDHRIAMSFAVAGLVSDGVTNIIDSECVNISYPNFYTELLSLTNK